jgi:hypothetical protein
LWCLFLQGDGHKISRITTLGSLGFWLLDTTDAPCWHLVHWPTLHRRLKRQAVGSPFGSCLRYLVYQVCAEQIRFIDIRSAVEADFAEDRNSFRVDLIKDCHLLYVVSVSGPAAAKIIRADIYPMKKIEGGAASDVLCELQLMMNGSQPPWLAKILGVPNAERFRYYDGEVEE